MTETRQRIVRRISDDPGIHYRELMRALDLAPGQVQYHLNRLLSTDRVARHDLYGRTHYYPPEYADRERTVLALLRRETARDVLVVLIEQGGDQVEEDGDRCGTPPAAVAAELGIARSTLEYHLDRLVEHDLVRKERDARGRVTLVAVAPAETAELLGVIAPSLPERLTDRFERLVDSLLEPGGTDE